LLRIPGSYNSKYNEEVKIFQRWDGLRPKANTLHYHFYIYLADRKLKEFNNMQRNPTESYRRNTIPWIEKLLETPIDDYRKNAINLILAPYLINVRRVSYNAALNIINSWLSKCGELRPLEQNFDYTVRYALKYSAKNGNRPLKLETLKMKNLMLYNLLK
jgi:Primase X